MTLLSRAAAIPGYANTRSKAPGRLWPIGEGPTHALHAEGCTILADDGRRYIDTLCALGAVSLGYAPLGKMTTAPECSLPFASEVHATEAILDHVAPWGEFVRFTRTGSEATTGALMVAMEATGREHFWRLRGSYHGWHRWWQRDHPGARWFTVGEVPDFSLTAPNGRPSVRPAAVIIEPPRWEPMNPDWYEAVVKAAHKAGALVILDEMIYGGRYALGGSIQYHGLTPPDLACFGKAIGNGSPVACIVGGEALRLHGELVSGTYSGDANAAWAVIDTLETYEKENVVGHMWEMGARLWDGLAQEGIPLEGQPVHSRIAFENEDAGHRFSAEMVKRGIIWHPACTNICLAHTAEIIDRVVEAGVESWGGIS